LVIDDVETTTMKRRPTFGGRTWDVALRKRF
jgi:hypothetical protein